ncbi:MAG TPA: response regulator [Candidatus Nitrosotenuis sp.]|jgi:DNA-binding NarL/FixJ family response regulator
MYEIPTAIVVDDSKMTVQVLCDYLAMIDVDVLGRGHNGKDAVELYKKYRPDIVFLDIMMPDYDGYYALENIKKMDTNAKVVVVTSDLRQKDSKELERLGPTKIIFKPFAIDTIKDIVEKIRKSKQK